MGRPIGSKNGQSSTSKGNSSTTSNSKNFITTTNGRKTTQKLSAVGKLSNGNNSNEGPKNDKSQIFQPYDIRINGFSSLLNTVKKANSKVKKLILEECDLILECRVCRNLFRSLPNYLSHKQLYCKKEYSPLADNGYSQFIQNSPSSYDFNYHLDESLIDSMINSTKNSSTPSTNNKDSISNNSSTKTYQNKINGSRKSPVNLDLDDKKVSRLHDIITRIAPAIENASRTPSEFYNDIIVRRNIETTTSSRSADNNNIGSLRNDLSTTSTIVTNHNNNNVTTRQGQNPEKLVHILFEPINARCPTDGIVFQKKIEYDPSNCDVPLSTKDKRSVLQPDSAVLGPDGKIICVGDSENVEKIVNRIIAQVEVKQEEQKRKNEELNCPHCLTMYPTRKFLRMHIRAAHRNSPDEDRHGDDKNAVDPQVVSQGPVTSDIYSTPTKKPRLEDSSGVLKEREASPDIVDWKSSSSTTSSAVKSTIGNIANTIVKSSPPKIIRNMQALFSISPKRPRGRPRGPRKVPNVLSTNNNINNNTSTNADEDDTNSTNNGNNNSNDNNNISQGTDISRRLSISDSSDSGELMALNVNKSSSSSSSSSLEKPFSRNMENNSHIYEKSTTSVNCQRNPSGAINLSLLRCPKSPEHKKISILVRHDYLKPNHATAATTTSTTSRGKSITPTITTTTTTTSNRTNAIVSQNSNKKNISRIKAHNNNNNIGDTADDKFGWTRWEPQNDNSSNNLYEHFDECADIANVKFYSTTGSKNRSPTSTSISYRHEHELDEDDDDDADEDNDEEEEEEEEEEFDEVEENDNRSGEHLEESSDSDDGLPEDEKNSNHENDTETDSNTDSGVSTRNNNHNNNNNNNNIQLKACSVSLESLTFQNLKES